MLEVPGVTEVYSVAGEFDLVAIVRVRQQEDLASVVTGRLLRLPTLLRTNTLIAFKAFSAHDLEQLFAIGADDGLGSN